MDMPQVGAATLALALAALLYLIYRDLRMLVQMVVDLKEEVMISRMADKARDEFEGESHASNSHASSDAGRREGCDADIGNSKRDDKSDGDDRGASTRESEMVPHTRADAGESGVGDSFCEGAAAEDEA